MQKLINYTNPIVNIEFIIRQRSAHLVFEKGNQNTSTNQKI